MSSLRCSKVAREFDVSPIGTAASFEGLVLFAAPPPWPRDAADVPAVLGRRDEWRGAPRIQLVTGAEAAGFEVAEYRTNAGPYHKYESDQPDGSLVLVCCHGRRDVCCGADGTSVAMELERRTPRSFRVLRTSHLGGHRFAPTALVLPEGTMWANVDADFLTGVVNRSIPVAEALSRYRGCTGLTCPEAQVADAGALMLNGWEWLDEPREVVVVARTEMSSEVSLRGARRGYRALVGVRRVVPSPTCGDATLTEATPVTPEY